MKLGGGDDDDARELRRCAAPRRQAELIVDANEGWDENNLAQNLAACAEAGVTLIEQPLPEGRDAALARIKRPIPVCADESVHDRASLDALAGKYDAINIKLDKTGGLTEALALVAEAERRGFAVMVGCMVATSLAMAPAMLVAQRASVVDLDGPLLLAKDRPDGLRYVGSTGLSARACIVGLKPAPALNLWVFWACYQCDCVNSALMLWNWSQVSQCPMIHWRYRSLRTGPPT